MNADEVTYGWIRNTLALDRVAISDNLRAQIETHAHAEIEREIATEWDDRGNLVSPFCDNGNPCHDAITS